MWVANDVAEEGLAAFCGNGDEVHLAVGVVVVDAAALHGRVLDAGERLMLGVLVVVHRCVVLCKDSEKGGKRKGKEKKTCFGSAEAYRTQGGKDGMDGKEGKEGKRGWMVKRARRRKRAGRCSRLLAFGLLRRCRS